MQKNYCYQSIWQQDNSRPLFLVVSLLVQEVHSYKLYTNKNLHILFYNYLVSGHNQSLFLSERQKNVLYRLV